MTLFEVGLFLIAVAYYGLMIWAGATSIVWITWERLKIRPLDRRINRLDFEIEEIEGHDFSRVETPESRGLRKARDIDKLSLNDEEERIDRFLRTWGMFRVFYRDPYSRSATRYTRERQRLQKSLGIVDS